MDEWSWADHQYKRPSPLEFSKFVNYCITLTKNDPINAQLTDTIFYAQRLQVVVPRPRSCSFVRHTISSSNSSCLKC